MFNFLKQLSSPNYKYEITRFTEQGIQITGTRRHVNERVTKIAHYYPSEELSAFLEHMAVVLDKENDEKYDTLPTNSINQIL